jgi:hypothetical protein
MFSPPVIEMLYSLTWTGLSMLISSVEGELEMYLNLLPSGIRSRWQTQRNMLCSCTASRFSRGASSALDRFRTKILPFLPLRSQGIYETKRWMTFKAHSHQALKGWTDKQRSMMRVFPFPLTMDAGGSIMQML